ncbi:hypothetical protein [Nocardioides rubriscoriae]|uniref:hypothetical protein n=1 Tax=Nocardioides rubriscoriae TaxID=642762 RepID=UPI0011DF3194|nr:hypothetical protein [Nocardioides rubriscoriae]
MSLRTQMYNCVFGVFVFGMATVSFSGQGEHVLAKVFGVLMTVFLAFGVVTALALVRARQRRP